MTTPSTRSPRAARPRTLAVANPAAAPAAGAAAVGRAEDPGARGLSVEAATILAGTLSLLSEPTRLRILYLLDQVGEMAVGDLASTLGVGEDAATYALRLLRTAGLVSYRKAGRSVIYRLSPDFPQPLLEHCLRQLVRLTVVPEDSP